MPNIEKAAITTATSCETFLADIAAATGLTAADMNCVGVMIQAGKTMTNLESWTKTVGGGHVSPFVVDKGKLNSWDEIGGDDQWQTGAEDSVCDDHDVVDDLGTRNGIFQVSSMNDVTCYVHVATVTEVLNVTKRATDLVDAATNPKPVYSHAPTFGKGQPKAGDCVSKTAYVLEAFSHSKPMQGGITPWMQSIVYEFYASSLNPTSGWYRIKYIGRKLNVM